MTVQEAMQKAVEGGYHIESADGVDITYSGANDEYSAWTRTDTESSFLVPVEETLLDPCFWQALGRKCVKETLARFVRTDPGLG